MTTQTKEARRLRYVSYWLLSVTGMVFFMAVVGAITRLTGSGLSMVEWRPFIGAIPPMSEMEWYRVFDLYRQTPEYVHKNSGMSLMEFKNIFFWEWFHRLWGRLIGLAYAVPLLVFLVLKWIPRSRLWPLIGILFLGLVQGFVGWYMVKSGLVDRPSVSHYRLSLHLNMAFVLYACLWWQALWFRSQSGCAMKKEPPMEVANTPSRLKKSLNFSLVPLSLTLIWGAFVAGLDAGLIYNEFPMMEKSLLPSEIWQTPSLWYGLFETPAIVQFVHRVLAVLTLIAVIVVWARVTHNRYPSYLRRAGHVLLFFAILQFSLGIITLLTSLMISMAAAHQAGALLLLAQLLYLRFCIAYKQTA